MNQVKIYDPPLCCSTGVCGVDVDQELVRMSADVDSLKQQGADISRFNLATDPSEFAGDDTVRAFLQVAGSAGLPLVTVGGVTVMTGRYPSQEQLATWAGVAFAAGPGALPMVTTDGACCSEPVATVDEVPAAAGGCCS